ncbi:MAG: hypothetical protein R2700_06540 [Solirubrobacterales bacterium]
MERRGLIGVALAVIALLLLAPAPASAAVGDLEFISRDDNGLAANDDAGVPVVSDDGNLVAFCPSRRTWCPAPPAVRCSSATSTPGRSS